MRTVAEGTRRHAFSLVFLGGIAWAGCGGESRSSTLDAPAAQAGGGALGGSGGSAGTSTAGGGGREEDPDVPRLSGVPIGDCTQPTAAEQLALGCPTEAPDVPSPCMQEGTVCRYDIRVEPPSSVQSLVLCVDGSWYGLTDQCGVTCGIPAATRLTFDASDCEERTARACSVVPNVYDYEASAKSQADALLAQVLEACGALREGERYELAFREGCPVELSVGTGIVGAEATCLNDLLGSVRLECASLLPCAGLTRGIF